MKDVLLRSAVKLNKERKRRKLWERIVSAMSAVVVFITTYALILPAITMETEAACGVESHTHTEECYTAFPVYAYKCGQDPGTVVLHTHNEFCVDGTGQLICQLPELAEHTHTDACYALGRALICQLPEEEPHTHDESCYSLVESGCALPETEPHTHDETCAVTEQVLTCEIPEAEGHTHGESCTAVTRDLTCDAHVHGEGCYTQEENLVCTAAEHTHGEGCYLQEEALTCTTAEHTHGAECFTETRNLICAEPESETHTHGDGCYETVTAQICGTAEHTHGELCTETVQTLVCTDAEHTHGEGCTETVRTLICTEADHIHEDGCYTETETVTCELPETQGHAHEEACYTTQTRPCDKPEGQGHTHSAECGYTAEEVLTCEKPETEGHSHTDECYVEEPHLICDKQELENHTHVPECMNLEGVIACGLESLETHNHTAECLEDTGEVRMVLTCGLEEHLHSDLCYPLEVPTESSQSDLLCGLGEHIHTEPCKDEAGNLICSIPEHVHEAACLVADLDLTADVEQPEDWEAGVAAVPITGNWPADLAAMAASQLGYTESLKNAVLTEGVLKGYTRYGAWYGDPYGDWSTLFAAFCLHYAGVKDYPTARDASAWLTALDTAGYARYPGTYEPKIGDLVFLDDDQIPGAPLEIAVGIDRVAIITGTEGGLTAITGDLDGTVAELKLPADHPGIIGYGRIPVGDTIVLTYHGTDYTVTVTFDRSAGIPDTALLAVREILPGTEEYDLYYGQSVEELLSKSGTETEEELNVSFARFFDISFVVDGVILEPTAPVDVQIQYSQSIEIAERDSGVAVHFAEDGIEVLEAETSGQAYPEENEVDTFAFTQGSFSVVGTVISTYSTNLGITQATTVDFNSLATGGTQYVLYVQYNGQYYAMISKAGDGKGYGVPVTRNADGTVTWETSDSRMFWSFTQNGAGSSYYVQNFSTARYIHAFDNSSYNNPNYGAFTSGRNPSNLTRQSDGSFIAQGNNYYVGVVVESNGTITFNRVSGSGNAARFYLARVGEFYNVWFDGTNGGMMSYYGAEDRNIPAVKDGSNPVTITLPETWQSSTKYPYKLRGWYDINTQTYYPVNPDDAVEVTAQISADTVFYADWIAATYDVGQKNSHTVNSLDTSNFITTHVFDYNVLFNVLSQRHTGTISAGSHSETWTMVNNGKVPYGNRNTLGFAFVDYDANGDFSYANERDNTNVNQGDAITPGIIQEVYNASGGVDLMDLLFNPDTQVIGKYYAGTGNYLFQYMDSTTANYDGVHDGYYYLDARLNAASYNQTAQRFYLYDYLERTSDSDKDGGVGQYSDFLPFNSPYIFEADQLDNYVDSVMRPGYEYDAKDGASSYQEYNSADDANTNYFFGIRTDIEFFLPNDAGHQDEYGNYGNISTRGEHMIFDFHGDDDVWVFVDGELVLDIGGLHGVMFGQIDFSTGKVISGKDGGTTTTRTFQEILGKNITDGTHTMTVYYMERGSSQSNCAIYFNIAPRYDLEITKEDIYTADKLDGAVFSIYDDEAMTIPSQLWTSEEAYHQDMQDGNADNTTNSFTVVDGVASCWGISAGKTYYIVETTPPPGYPLSNDLIRITLNNRGTATIETTTLHGPDGEATEGFAVIKQNVNDTLKIVALTVTNQQDMETTEVRVKKTWADGSTDIPASITVYLTADGVRVGRTATLTAANGWSYTWKGLPKYSDDEATQEIIYAVEEILVPNYITTQTGTEKVVDHVDWIRTAQMSDSETYLLVHNGQALTYNGSSFGWMDVESAKLDSGTQAQWKVTTDHDGFHLKNGAGYTLTYNTGGYFYGTTSDAVNLNQVIYYLNSRLVVHDHDVYYQFGANGAAVREDGLAFTLYQKEAFTGFLVGIENVPVQEDKQTYVEVTKVWDDGADRHVGDSVTIRLLADGKDTGRYVILDASNNWSGGFYDLPYYQVDGTTPIVYTVVEDEFPGYAVSYSGPTTLPGEALILWPAADSLSVGNTYRFLSGSYALTVLSDGTVTTAAGDLSDTRQQWTVEDVYGLRLKNLATGQYLARSGTWLYMTGNVWEAAVVTMDAGRVKLGDMFLELGSGYATATSNGANVTGQTITQRTETNAMPGTGYTVTNAVSFTLPNTGGMGTDPLTFGGAALLTASAMMYCCINGRKRRKGGDSNE